MPRSVPVPSSEPYKHVLHDLELGMSFLNDDLMLNKSLTEHVQKCAPPPEQFLYEQCPE